MWFEIASLRPAARFRQRRDTHGNWLPPRRRDANLKAPASWFQYINGQTKSVAKVPPRHLRRHYKTYSFYTDRNRIFVYPADASVNKIGDGSGSPQLVQSSTDDRYESDSTDSDTTDSDSTDCASTDGSEGDRGDIGRRKIAERLTAADWRELSFSWYERDGASISHAMFGGPQRTLNAPYADRGQHQELLPPWYHANSNALSATAQQGKSGFTGELPVLVALVALSAAPQGFLNVLELCMGTNYRSHGGFREQLCELSRQ